jgi:polygalacturonase
MREVFGLVPVVVIGVVGAVFGQWAPPAVPPEVKFAAEKVVMVTEVGGVADGVTLCNGAIDKAIEQCVAAGGGIVELPRTEKGAEYLAGAIALKSNITLQIDEGVTLKFTTDRTKYPLVKTRYECTDVMNYSPLIYAYKCENVRIAGKGTLDGQGATWWTWRNGKPAANVLRPYTNDREGKFPLEQRVFGETVQGLRPCFIEPYECKNVVIEGVTVKNSPFWTIHPLYSENVTVRGVTVFGDGPNTDGCDPDSCQTVLIEKCNFTTGDDCIAIKSGRDGDGIRRNRPCENITVRDCTMKGGHGAVTMGSETSGWIRHVLAENCAVDGPDSAVRLKSTRGRGGGIEDVLVRNMTVTSTRQFAITINMRYTQTTEAAVSETTPVFRNIRIEDFTCGSSAQAMEILGLNESRVENVFLKDVTIAATRGARLEYVTGLLRENVKVMAGSGEGWTLMEVKEARP